MKDTYSPAPAVGEGTGEWATENADRTSLLAGGAHPLHASRTDAGNESSVMPPSTSTNDFPRTFGNYELLSEIARGGMGVVYRARQKGLARIVALKTILPSQVSGKTAIDRFYQEAQAAAGLDHPGIVAIHEIGEVGGEHFFTMAFVEGKSLTALVREGTPLPAEQAASLVAAVADAVHYAHERGIMHRDLKPDNVLLDASGRPRVTDFGLAKSIASTDQGLTQTGQIVGTPAYMSPEQALGGKRVIGAPSDVYALGGILYFLLTGKAPFTGDSITELLCKVAQERPESPCAFADGVPSWLEAVCLKSLEKKAEDRYASAAELAQALRSAASVPIPATAARSAAPARKPATASWGVALAVAALVGVGAVVALRLAFPRERPLEEPKGDPVPGKMALVAPKPEEKPKSAPPAVALVGEDGFTPRNDFGLKVEMVGTKEAGGVHKLLSGQLVRFRVRVARDAYVGLWTIDHKGAYTQLFPHKDKEGKLVDNLVKADAPRLVPGEGIEIEAEMGEGLERVYAVASTKKWDEAKGEQIGPVELFKQEREREKLKTVLRGLRVRPVGEDAKMAEQSLLYEVTKP